MLAFLIPRLAWLYLHFVGATSRIVWIRRQQVTDFENARESFIFAFWHGRQVFFTYLYKNMGAYALVSKSKDGEYIARVLHHFGFGTVRGSSSRGGMKAIIEMKRKLEEGKTIGITPDGPRGPQRTINPGALFLALKTGKKIVPISCSASRKLVFHGWDDYWIPLPFSKWTVTLGEFISVGPNDDLERKAAQLQATLNRLTDEADKKLRELA